jgi:hypothetical protein
LRNLKKEIERIFDRPERHHILPSSIWLVAHEYGIVRDEPPGSQLKKVVVKQAQPEKPPYIPFERTDLFLSFTRLATRGKPSEKSVLGWVNKYGLLRKVDDDEDLYLPNLELNQAPILVQDFQGEVLEARSTLDLYTDLSSGGIDDLRKRIGILRARYERMEPLSDLDTYLVEEWGGEADKVGQRTFVVDGFQFWATLELESRVKDKLENVRPTIWSDYAGQTSFHRYRPAPSWQCPDLISAMYLQLYLWMTEGLPMHRCANPACGTPFPITRRDKRVCSPSCRSNLRHYPHLQRHR